MEFMCRVCETIYGLKNMFEEENEELLLMLRSVANITIEADDPLPKYICSDCTQNLHQANNFIKKCENTDEKLRKIHQQIDIHSTNTELPSIEEIDSDLIDNCVYENYFEDDSEEHLVNCEKITNTSPVESYDYDRYMNEDDIIVDERSVIDVKMESFVEENLEYLDNENYTENIKDVEFKVESLDDSQNSKIEIDFVNDDEYDESNNKAELLAQIAVEMVKKEETTTKSCRKNSTKEKNISKLSVKKVFKCNSCSQVYSSFNGLNVHKKEHGENRFECSICFKRFSRHYRLRDHLLTHGEPLKLPCNLCDKTYTNRGNLERHIKHCHNKEKPHACETCGMSFARKASLRMHSAIHSDARPFECELCGKKFKTAYYLNVHNKSHVPIELRTKNRPKQKRKIQICICPYCGKKSTSHTLHVNHLRTHTGEKPFVCRICSKRFPFKQSLRSHMLTHSGEKPYSCDMCGIAFRQIGHLKGHKLAIHSGLKQHKCQYCDKSFALRSNLTIHERLHTGEKPYPCTICPKRFSDTNGLKRHKLSHVRHMQTVPSEQEQKNDLNQIDVSLDQLNVYLDELGNEYTEIIETETTLETIT